MSRPGASRGAGDVLGESVRTAPPQAKAHEGMPILIVSTAITLDELRRLAGEQFGDFVKAVVDLGRGVMAIGGELHADEEAVLLQDGARQRDLWGINLYPDRPAGELVEFDSMINLRPSQDNRSRGVEDAETRRRILDVIGRLVGS